MTREEAIERMKIIKGDCYIIDNPKDKEAFDMSISALEQQPCDDAISRILKRMWNCRGKHTTSIDKVKMEQIIRDELPPVTQKSGKWIPVSERLPEESLNSVIGWDAYRERCVFVQYIDGYFQITGSDESFDIVAWMPLPESYEPQESEEISERNMKMWEEIFKAERSDKG